MRRGRISRVSNSNSKRGRKYNRNAKHKQVHDSGPSISDLPNEILHNIFSRLLIRSIFVCKSVCKNWHDLISDPEFARLHFDETCDKAYPLIHISDLKSRSEKFYLAQLQKEDFELKLGMCEHTYSNPGCVCNVEFALKKNFELSSPDSLFYHEEAIFNSCNGLLCLSIPTRNNSLVIICNPVTREFINLPKGKNADLSRDFIVYGFGFSDVANKYKVVKVIYQDNRGNDPENRTFAQVHIVGTKMWRNISSKPARFIDDRPTYFKGLLYWASSYDRPTDSLSLISFDIENESFGLDLGPKVEPSVTFAPISVGVLAEELCISSITEAGTLHVWSTKDYSVEKAWSEVIFINMHSLGKEIYYSYGGINYLSDGSLMLYEENAIVHFDPRKCRFRYLKIRGKKLKVKAIIDHIPSLVSLKHSLPVHNVKVLNLLLRCKELESNEQIKGLHLVEKAFPNYYFKHE